MFLNGHGIKEYIMLRTETQAFSHHLYVSPDVISVNVGSATARGKEPYGENRILGCFMMGI